MTQETSQRESETIESLMSRFEKARELAAVTLGGKRHDDLTAQQQRVLVIWGCIASQNGWPAVDVGSSWEPLTESEMARIVTVTEGAISVRDLHEAGFDVIDRSA